MVRVGAAFVAAPVFGAVAIPLPVRVSLSGAIGVLVLAVHPVTPPADIFAVSTVLSVAAEALVGLALGFVLQIAFAAPMVASEVIGMSMGLGFANSVDPQAGASTPALGTYAFFAGLLLALPVGFLLLCLNMVVGMISRSAPSLNLFAVGLPASLAVGVVALAIAFPAMGDYMQVIVRQGLAATQSLVLG